MRRKLGRDKGGEKRYGKKDWKNIRKRWSGGKKGQKAGERKETKKKEKVRQRRRLEERWKETNKQKEMGLKKTGGSGRETEMDGKKNRKRSEETARKSGIG